jgi:hypothetical protein
MNMRVLFIQDYVLKYTLPLLPGVLPLKSGSHSASIIILSIVTAIHTAQGGTPEMVFS